MGNLALFFGMMVLAAPAFAGSGQCAKPEQTLVCNSAYKLVSGYGTEDGSGIMQGPVGSDMVADRASEPFNASECMASVVLLNYAGRFVATYSEASGTISAWLESDGKTQTMPTVARRIAKYNVNSPFKGIVETVTFNCYVVGK